MESGTGDHLQLARDTQQVAFQLVSGVNAHSGAPPAALQHELLHLVLFLRGRREHGAEGGGSGGGGGHVDAEAPHRRAAVPLGSQRTRSMRQTRPRPARW